MEEREDVRHQAGYDRWERRESEAYVGMAGHSGTDLRAWEMKGKWVDERKKRKRLQDAPSCTR